MLWIFPKRIINALERSGVCRYKRRIYVVLLALWLLAFTWIALMSQVNERVYTKKAGDYRDVPELLQPPVELSVRERSEIRVMIDELQSKGYFRESRRGIFTSDFLPKWPFIVPRGLPLIDPKHITNTESMSLGEKFSFGARQFSLYDPKVLDVEQLLKDMSTRPVVMMEEVVRGTQLKFKLFLEDYGPVMFKPQRYDRSYETSPNQFYFSDYERHNSEIAAFHLDKILGWYRAPPVVGRQVNITRDLMRFAKSKLKETFFLSPANNWCFYGKCKYYCDTTNAFCGHPDMVEGSFATFLPPDNISAWYKIKSPWRRSYNKHKTASWENNSTYCYYVRLQNEFSKGRRLLDIIDSHVLDFLIGNMDRHHYLFYKGFPNNNTFHLHFDHGRGFGRVNHDELSILSPLTQCCQIRYSTLYKLITFHNGDYRLGYILRRSLDRDPVSPVLAEGHYEAVDRRVSKILAAVAKCLFTHPANSVVRKDGY